MITLIEFALSILEKGPALIGKWIAIGRQSGELTDEQAAEYTRRQEAAFASPAWNPNRD